MSEGTKQANRVKVIQGVRKHPNLTAAVLAEKIGLDYHEVQRRVSECIEVVRGSLMVCPIKGTKCSILKTMR